MSNTIESIVDAEKTFPVHSYIGKTAYWISLILSSVDHPELWDAACRMSDRGDRYAQFAGVTITGSFLWNTGVGLWETN